MSQVESEQRPVVDLRLLLERTGVDPDTTLVMRHVPDVPKLAQRLRWFAAEQPHIYNAFQRTHGARVESSLAASTHLASFLGDGTGRALFVGLYEVGGDRRVTVDEFYAVEENRILRDLGSRGPDADHQRRWFDLTLTDRLLAWKGRLVVGWSEGRTYARRPRPGVFGVLAVHEEDQLSAAVPDPLTLTVDWADFCRLPTSWWRALAQWRGVYYIRHRPSGKGYVGAAYATENIANRWQRYAENGHGGNRLLRPLDPNDFVFSIIQLVSPLADPNEVLKLEASWKRRLHTRSPEGLNDN